MGGISRGGCINVKGSYISHFIIILKQHLYMCTICIRKHWIRKKKMNAEKIFQRRKWCHWWWCAHQTRTHTAALNRLFILAHFYKNIIIYAKEFKQYNTEDGWKIKQKYFFENKTKNHIMLLRQISACIQNKDGNKKKISRARRWLENVINGQRSVNCAFSNVHE